MSLNRFAIFAKTKLVLNDATPTDREGSTSGIKKTTKLAHDSILDGLIRLLIRCYEMIQRTKYGDVYSYLLAIVFSIVNLFLRLLIAPIEGGLQFITFFPCVALSAMFVGAGPALLSTALCSVMAGYFFFPPYMQLTFEFHSDVVLSTLVFCLDGLIVSMSIGAMHRYFIDYRQTAEVMQNKEAQFQMIVDSIRDYAIIMLDVEGNIISWNPGAEQNNGYQKNDILGQHFSILYPQEDIENGKPEHDLGIAINEGRFEDENLRIRKEGSPYKANVVITAIRGSRGKLSGFAEISCDITERKKAEMRMHHLLYEYTRSNDELNNFAYVASHDLKSPLRGIDQLATWLAEDLGDQLSDGTKKHLHLMRNRIQRMERLLDDLLAYSRVGHTDDEIVKINTRDLVQDIYEMITDNRGIQLDIADPMPVLQTSKVPLELVFRNLINNAIKHHDKPEGCIRISAHTTTDGYEFVVSDDGPGIAADNQKRVFGMFQTLKSRDEVEGSGIGLSMVKKAVESVGGKVTLESDGTHGCTFRFTWPKTITAKILNVTTVEEKQYAN